jgi:SAM-dependent methyltransferase
MAMAPRPTDPDGQRISEQRDYYEHVATEFDGWLAEAGAYDLATQLARGDEISSICEALRDFRPTGNVLEIACGSGQWTKQLVAFADRVVALDSSPTMLAINAKRTASDKVEYVEADIFSWQPAEKFDVVFFGFWLSHVPDSRFTDFWNLVRSSLAPNGRFFFVDDHIEYARASYQTKRKLSDGREFEVFKVLHRSADLQERLRSLGWDIEIVRTGSEHMYGAGHSSPLG